MKQEFKLYNDKLILTFDDTHHIYTVNGKTVYGVTSITGIIDKPALKYWAVNMGIEYLKENLKPGKALDEIEISTLLTEAKSAHTKRLSKAGDIGTLIHEWLGKYIKARIEKKPIPKRPVNKEMQKAIDGFFSWARKNEVKLIASEQKVYSKRYGYAGTFDLFASVNGKKTIIDFKTSKEIYPEMFLQASAYLQAKEEELGKTISGGVSILRLSKENKEIIPFEVCSVDRKEVSYLIKVFYCCLGIYKWQMKNKKRSIVNKLK